MLTVFSKSSKLSLECRTVQCKWALKNNNAVLNKKKSTKKVGASVTQITKQWRPQMASQLCLIYTWENCVTQVHFMAHKQKHSFVNFLVNPLNFSDAMRLPDKFYLAWNFDLTVCISRRYWLIKKSSWALGSYIQTCIIKLSLIHSGMKLEYSIWDPLCSYHHIIFLII